MLRIATARRRLVGKSLDVCASLTSLVLIFYGLMLLRPTLTAAMPDGVLTAVMMTVLVSPVAVYVVFKLGLVAWWGRTLGQRIVGLRIVDFPYGTPVRGWGLAWRRGFVLRGTGELGPFEDLLKMLADSNWRRCDHDERAGTVVVNESRALTASSGPATPASPVRSTPFVLANQEAARAGSDRAIRILLATMLGLALAAAAALVTLKPAQQVLEESQEPPLAFGTFYDDKKHFEVRSPTGRTGTFERTVGRALDGESGCTAGAVDTQVRGLLRELGCQGQIEAAFRTTDGVVEASGHVLKFVDAAAARRAAKQLRWDDLRFVPGGSAAPTGTVHGGMVDHEDRYVVVTSVVAAKGAGAADKAENALILLHTPTLNVIILKF